MTCYEQLEKKMSGFVYIWFDRKHKRYYVGSHWGSENDSYVCSSSWMKRAYKLRPGDFKRRIISKVSTSRKDLLVEEGRWLAMINREEMRPLAIVPRYYNLNNTVWEHWHTNDESRLSVGEKISKAKIGKNTGTRDPEVGKKISEAKLQNNAKKRERLGYVNDPEHRKAVSQANKGRVVTQESNEKRAESMRQAWAEGRHARANHPKKEKAPSRKPGEKVQELWLDPSWKENQRARLRSSWEKRRAKLHAKIPNPELK